MPFRETALRLFLLAVLLAGATGCKVQVDKSSNGEGDNVKIATPFGGIDDQQKPDLGRRTWSPRLSRRST